MASNVQGIAITIKAFLPTGKTLDEQFEALSLVKTAHASGDYADLLKAAKIDEVKTEQRVRRIEDAPADTNEETNEEAVADTSSDLPDDWIPEPTADPDDEIPEFLKSKRKSAA